MPPLKKLGYFSFQHLVTLVATNNIIKLFAGNLNFPQNKKCPKKFVLMPKKENCLLNELLCVLFHLDGSPDFCKKVL